MQVLFVSNCQHKAWARTRAILDRYATRIGERAWTTPITQQALEEVHAALRRKASRNTSVACYRNDPVLGMRMLWVVGNTKHYDKNGRFAVAFRQKVRTFPRYLRMAAMCAKLAGLAHDLGKMNKRFQWKLLQATRNDQKDRVRHEWLSAYLFKHLVSGQERTLEGLRSAWNAIPGKVRHDEIRASPVREQMQSLLDATGLAICTHHGAIGGSLDKSPLKFDGSQHVRGTGGTDFLDNLSPKIIPSGKSDDVARWQAVMKGIDHLVSRMSKIACSDPALLEKIMLVARASLVLADHSVSSKKYEGDPEREGVSLYANTKNKEGRKLDQPLSWHLLEVGELAARNVTMFSGDLPAMGEAQVARFLGQKSVDPRYVWQDRAADAVSGLDGGKLVFNVASTGAGKTLGNLKLALAMRPKDARIAVAFNLRTLTKQTYAAYKKAIGVYGMDEFERDFACLVGFYPTDDGDFMEDDEESGDQHTQVDVEGAAGLMLPPWMDSIVSRYDKERLATIVAVPVLISTMDWIVAAGEPGEQVRHVLALLRVASSDLILDEVDSYDVGAVVAVMRVVKIAAMFGRNVIVSSATLSPALADGLIKAYESGWRANGKDVPWNFIVVHDDMGFTPQIEKNLSAGDAVVKYRAYMNEIAALIAARPALRRMEVFDIQDKNDLQASVARQAMVMHERFSYVPDGLRCRLSIGLIRMANVKPCMEMAEFLRQSGDFVVCAYHSQDVLERRKVREELMDKILSRKPGENWVAELIAAEPWIKGLEGDVRLVVVATPIEEVGRDHDFDWAIIEPSSMHSIIQTAGRVNRHRQIPQYKPNVAIMSKNVRALDDELKCFVFPGFECESENGTSTHPDRDARTLLEPISGNCMSDVLDAGLIFSDARKTKFALYDEAGVEEKLRRANIVFSRDDMRLGMMLDNFAREYRLRDSRIQFFKLLIDNLKFRRIDEETDLGSVRMREKGMPNTWLCPDIERLAEENDGIVHAAIDTGKNKTIERIDIKWNGIVMVTAN